MGLENYALSEPDFGQIKQVRGFQQFLLRGLGKVSAEWDLICLGHNVLKLFRSNWRPQQPELRAARSTREPIGFSHRDQSWWIQVSRISSATNSFQFSKNSVQSL